MGSELESLVREAKRGNDDAFYELMQLEKERLYRIAFRYMRNEHDALEAIQETTFRAYRSLPRLRETIYVQTWLIRILLNYCADETAKRKRIVHAERIEPSFEESGQTDRIALSDAVDSLEPPYRQVVLLKYYEDLTVTEVARVMERPEGTVKTWLNKALRLLRMKIGKEW